MKNQKGITLIALVITIIVLLILAGVSIAMLTGDNGLLTKSNEAATKEKIAGAKDVVTTEVAALGAKWYEAKYVTTPATELAKDAYIMDGFEKNAAEGCTIDTSTNTFTVYVTGATTGDITAVGTLSDGAITWSWGTK